MFKNKKATRIFKTQKAATPTIKGHLARTILEEIKNSPSSKASDGAKKIIALFEKQKH